MRYFLELQYKGTNYSGWQRQNNANSIQAQLEQALSVLLKQHVRITGSGRTDAGVHARQQFAHFDTVLPIDDSSRFLAKLNGILPSDILAKDLLAVHDCAHARFDAIRRTYEYWVYCRPNPFLQDKATFFTHTADFCKMNQLASSLLYHTDFRCLSTGKTDVKHFRCQIYYAQWHSTQCPVSGSELWNFRISANRFLRGMVRTLVGTLWSIGTGQLSEDNWWQAFHTGRRQLMGKTAPATGLYLTEVRYPYLTNKWLYD